MQEISLLPKYEVWQQTDVTGNAAYELTMPLLTPPPTPFTWQLG
jgi:hypothetical protein